MDENSETRWQSKRKWFLINTCVGAFLIGLSLTGYYPTEYYYLKKAVKVDNPDLYFGLSWAFLYSSGVVSSFVGSYYADRTKHVRHICLLEDVFNIVGNIMYALYYSPAFILLGQLLVGTTAARASASIGELFRIDDSTEISRKIATAGIFQVLGTVAGPCTTYLFQYVEFNLGNWKINIGNAIGIAMLLLYVIQLILNYFSLHNVSKEYTLKDGFNCVIDKNKNDNFECTESLTFSEKYKLALRATLKNKHIRFWYFVTFVASYARRMIQISIVIKAAQYLHWGETDIALAWIISLCGGVIPSSIICTLLSKQLNDFYQFLASMIMLLLALLLLGLLPMVKDYYNIARWITLVIAILLNISAFQFTVFSKSILAKFVPENIQSISEGIRNLFYQTSALLGGLTVIFPAKYLSQTMFLLAFVISGCTGWYIAEQATFMNVKVISVKYAKAKY